MLSRRIYIAHSDLRLVANRLLPLPNHRTRDGSSGLATHLVRAREVACVRTPHLYHNLEEHWLTPRLVKMELDEKGMGWHSFKRFRKTWLRGARCLEDINNFWMAHKPQTMSEVYSHLHEELRLRLDEAERVGYGFVLPKRSIVPIVPKSQEKKMEVTAA